MKTYFPMAVALAVILVGVLLQGTWTERWGAASNATLDEFTARLAGVPKVIGDWESVETQVDPRQLKAANCTAHISRIYKNHVTGEEVSVFLVTGTGRHMTIHTPDWCYVAAGFNMDGTPEPFKIDCGPEIPTPEFATTAFHKETSAEMIRLRIFWAYSSDGQWNGPQYPRTFYAGKPALCKVYLISPFVESQRTPDQTPSMQFAKSLLPVLNQLLFTSPETSTAAKPSAEMESFATAGGE